MSWFGSFLSSSIGRKTIMSLTGLFLCLFLAVHMSGNLQLFKNDCGQSFNIYTKFMTNFGPIKIISYVTYFFILLHSFQGIYLAYLNKKARPINYAQTKANQTTWASRSMALLGTVMLLFIVIHMKSFWFELKFGTVATVSYDGHEYKDLYKIVVVAFGQWWYIAFYLFSVVVVGLHLWHGFQSAFQSLGLNHKKYTPLIKAIGVAFTLIISIGFALQPLYIFLTHASITQNCLGQ